METQEESLEASNQQNQLTESLSTMTNQLTLVH